MPNREMPEHGPVELAYRARLVDSIKDVFETKTIDTQSLACIYDILLTWQSTMMDIEGFAEATKELHTAPQPDSEPETPRSTPVAASDKAPTWTYYTPDELLYSLTMYDSNALATQDIDLTREEFCALKSHLAALRGYGARPADTTNS